MKDGFTRIASFPEPTEANLAKAKLESEGIEVFVANENTIRMDYFYSQALGGVQIFVPDADVERATAALDATFPLAELEAEAMASAPPEPARSQNSAICPTCSASNVYNERRPRPLTVLFFFFGLPFWLFRKNKRCANCGKRW